MHTALYTLFHHIAGYGIRRVHIASVVIIVRTASSAAYEFRKTVFTALSREQAVRSELFSDCGVKLAFVNVAHQKLFLSRELVTGVNIAVRHDREILVARAAGGNLFVKANPAFEVDVEMEKIETFALFMLFEVSIAQRFVLGKYFGNMLFLYRKVVYLRDDGLHGYAVETVFGKEQHVLGKVEIAGGESSADVIILIPARTDEFFDFADYKVRSEERRVGKECRL